MSHFTTIQTQIKDLQALADACRELGLELQTGAPCRGYAGLLRKAEHTIKLQGPYDIAVDPAPETPGRFDLTSDWWGGHVEKEVGSGYGRLLQSYGIAKTTREAQLRGFRVSRQIESCGSVLLTLEGGGL